MPKNIFRVQQIDHVELLVTDQYQAAEWFKQRLGLEIIPEYTFWADEGGPLMITSDDGRSKLALFQGEGPGFVRPIGFQRVAFRTSGPDFLTFVERLQQYPVHRDTGEPAQTLPIIDHTRSYSVYFADPDGNRFEITTYDYEYVNGRI